MNIKNLNNEFYRKFYNDLIKENIINDYKVTLSDILYIIIYNKDKLFFNYFKNVFYEILEIRT